MGIKVKDGKVIGVLEVDQIEYKQYEWYLILAKGTYIITQKEYKSKRSAVRAGKKIAVQLGIEIKRVEYYN